MRHRDRVQAALHHGAPDRCPMQVSLTPEFADRLRQELGIAAGALHNPHGGGNTYVLERTLGQDMLLTSVGWANSYYASERYAAGSATYTDEWGVGWQNVPFQTPFTDPSRATGHAHGELLGHGRHHPRHTLR